MRLTNCELGSLIELRDERNSDLQYGIEYVRGINNLKQLMATKVDVSSRDLSKFSIVYPGDFVFNHRTSRNGDKFSIAYNNSSDPIICTEDYVVFRINPEGKKKLLNEWLYMFFCRAEFDRYVITNSWGSSTEFYNWDDVCDINIDLPPLSVQQKYVDIYISMLENQRSYERGLDDLKLICDAYVEELRRKMSCEEIRPYISEVNIRNTELNISNIRGVSSKSEFGETKADTIGLDLHNYKIVKKGQFAYNPSRINLGSIALLTQEECVVSPMYVVFEIANKKKLLPQYLMAWFGRKEFKRSTLFFASGSVRDTFGFDVMQEVKIPIPAIEVQQDIANIYTSYIMRKEINERLKTMIKDICPILIKCSLEESC